MAGAADSLIKELLGQPNVEELLALHRWPDELDRWHELTFALLNPIIPESDLNVRELIDLLAERGLLDVEFWRSEPAKATVAVAELREWLAAFGSAGLDQDVAMKAALLLGQTAALLHDRFEGKAQILLRRASTLAMRFVVANLAIDGLDEDQKREAAIFWLQNVANLPLSLEDASVRDFCASRGVTPEELFQAADRMDLNVAVVDDLVHRWTTAGGH